MFRVLVVDRLAFKQIAQEVCMSNSVYSLEAGLGEVRRNIYCSISHGIKLWFHWSVYQRRPLWSSDSISIMLSVEYHLVLHKSCMVSCSWNILRVDVCNVKNFMQWAISCHLWWAVPVVIITLISMHYFFPEFSHVFGFQPLNLVVLLSLKWVVSQSPVNSFSEFIFRICIIEQCFTLWLLKMVNWFK